MKNVVTQLVFHCCNYSFTNSNTRSTAGQLKVHTNFINLFLQTLKSTTDYCTIHNTKLHIAITTQGNATHCHNMVVAIVMIEAYSVQLCYILNTRRYILISCQACRYTQMLFPTLLHAHGYCYNIYSTQPSTGIYMT